MVDISPATNRWSCIELSFQLVSPVLSAISQFLYEISHVADMKPPMFCRLTLRPVIAWRPPSHAFQRRVEATSQGQTFETQWQVLQLLQFCQTFPAWDINIHQCRPTTIGVYWFIFSKLLWMEEILHQPTSSIYLPETTGVQVIKQQLTHLWGAHRKWCVSVRRGPTKEE